jgi:hypothetical protein
MEVLWWARSTGVGVDDGWSWLEPTAAAWRERRRARRLEVDGNGKEMTMNSNARGPRGDKSQSQASLLN